MPMGLHLGLGLGNPPQGIALEAETQAYLTAQGANPFTGATANAVNNTIKELKRLGLWSTTQFAGLYFLANPTDKVAAPTLVNAINPTDATIGTATAVNAPTWDSVTGLGWTGGTGKAINTKNKFSLGLAGKQNNISMGVYNRTINPAAAYPRFIAGFYNTYCNMIISIRNTNNQTSGSAVASNFANSAEIADNLFGGLVSVDRKLSNVQKVFRNGVEIAADNRISIDPTNYDYPKLLLAASSDENGAITYPSSSQICFAWIGASIQDNIVSFYNTILNFYLIPLGLNV